MRRRGAKSEAGFTLLEISMAVMIGLLMLSLAMPSMKGLFGEQRLREQMGEFEAVVRKAAALARESKLETRLRWFKEGVTLEIADNINHDNDKLNGVDRDYVFKLSKEEVLELRRVAARADAQVLAEWSFWPNGIREPSEVGYSGPLGTWVLRFGPLVPDPDLVTLRAK